MLDIIRKISAELAVQNIDSGLRFGRTYRDPKVNARVQLQAQSRARGLGKRKRA